MGAVPARGYDARCYAVLILVEDEGLSISQIARMRGLSRQLVSVSTTMRGR